MNSDILYNSNINLNKANDKEFNMLSNNLSEENINKNITKEDKKITNKIDLSLFINNIKYKNCSKTSKNNNILNNEGFKATNGVANIFKEKYKILDILKSNILIDKII